MTSRGPAGDRATGTPSPYTSNEKVTLPGGTPSARRLAWQVHAPESAGLEAVHITAFVAPARVAENTTFVNVVTPGPEAVGLAESVVV